MALDAYGFDPDPVFVDGSETHALGAPEEDSQPRGRGAPWPMVGAGLGLSALSGGVSYAVTRTVKSATTTALVTLGLISVWEFGWWLARRHRRGAVYGAAVAMARHLGRPLVVIGAPDGGSTSGYGCGDITIDVASSACPNWIPADISQRTGFADDSVVVFCSCVLEYVRDPIAAINEIERISGGYAYFVGVEPWTLAALFYPGARQTLPPAYR